MLRLLLCAAVGAAGIVAFFSGAQAAMIASDNASNAPYNDGWQAGDNGGTGWGGAWVMRNQTNVALGANNGSRGTFVGNSINNNSGGTDSNGDGDINTPVNRAWGAYSNATDQVYTVRPFSGALNVGQTVTWDMDNGNIASGQVVGLRFLSNAADVNSREFEIRFVGGDSFYSTVSSPNQTTTIGFTREGLRLEYTLTSASTFSLKVTRLQSGATQTINGNNLSSNPLVALAFKNQFAGSGGAADAFLNSIAIPNNAPIVADAVINNVNASIPGMVQHTFTASDVDLQTLTWGNFQFGTYTPAYGSGPGGPGFPGGSQMASFDTGTQEFEWNTVGSSRGIYTWHVTADDGAGGSDQGTITVHITEVPEPTSLALGALLFAVPVCFFGRRK